MSESIVKFHKDRNMSATCTTNKKLLLLTVFGRHQVLIFYAVGSFLSMIY